MRQPSIYSATEIKNWDCERCSINHGWIPARPEEYSARTIFWRFRLAWLVFTGKADVLGWQE